MSRPDQTNPTEDRQRERIDQDWERITFGTHCVNCIPANCVFYLFVKDGKVVREETAGVFEPAEEGVPDLNPLLCQKALAWSREL